MQGINGRFSECVTASRLAMKFVLVLRVYGFLTWSMDVNGLFANTWHDCSGFEFYPLKIV